MAPQHDYVIANGSGSAVRSDLNNALAAIVSLNSGTSEPTDTFAYMLWADTTAGVLKIRNAANNAWITLRELDGTLIVESGSASAPGIYFGSLATTGIYSPGLGQVAITTNSTQRVTWTLAGVIFNDGGENYDFRVEGDTKPNLFSIDASADEVSFDGNVTIANQNDLRFGDSDNSNWVALQAPATVSSNVTFTLPAADGSAKQVISTDGSGALSFANPGTILQVVNATYGTQSSTAGTTYVDTGLTATITPKLATSKILVLVNQSGLQKTAGTYIQLRLLRGASSILEFEKSAGATANTDTSSPAAASCCYLDSPATTSATTYKTQFKSFTNVTGVGAVYTQVSSESSTITLMEVAQ